MKKTLSVILAVLLASSLVCLAVSAEGTTVTIDMTAQGFADAAEITDVTSGAVTVTFDKGTGSTTPKYYNNGTAARAYGGNTVTVASTGDKITGIVLTFSSTSNTGTLSADGGTYAVSGTTGTWSGSAASVIFTNTASSGHARIMKIEVTLGGEPAVVTEPETPSYTTPAEIVTALYALEPNTTLAGGPYTLTGVVNNIDSAYNSSNGNVTVTITVEGKDVQCYRLVNGTSDKCASIQMGDTVTVKGQLKHYQNKAGVSTYEFDSGCTLEDYKATAPEAPTYSTPAEILDALYKLEAGKSLAGGPYTLEGKITEIVTEYSSEYKNVTVKIVVGNDTTKPVTCYRMKGDGADVIAVGDTVKVTGSLKHYKDGSGNSTYEFDQNCSLDSYEKAAAAGTTSGQTTAPSTGDPAGVYAVLAAVAICAAAAAFAVSRRKAGAR
jgi:hypothetical protein